MPRSLTPRSSLERLKHEAKRWLKDLRAGEAAARARLTRALPHANPDDPTLREIQRALAIEHGFAGWAALKDRLDPDHPLRRYERVADALVLAFDTADDDAMLIVWNYFGHRRTWDAMKRYVRLAVGRTETAAAGESDTLTLDEARYIVARGRGFDTWAALVERVGILRSGQSEWDGVLAALAEQRFTRFRGHGDVTDRVLEQLTRHDFITELDLSGSRGVTDDGVRHLARLPALRTINLQGCSITDRSLAVLGALTHLESIELGGTAITDAGVAHLAGCARLARLDLSGTLTGDGAIRALAGKAKLADFRSGHDVTDAGLPLLHELPMFKRWHGGPTKMWLTGYSAEPTYLLLRGRIADAAFAQLRGLDGLFALNIDSGQMGLTAAAVTPLADLPHLGWLAFDAKDESMPAIAALPHLRFLLCQDTTATDDGFVALSRSRTLESIWGRRCYGLGERGLRAMSTMPALAAMSVSLKNVGERGLAALPDFPALTELMPMDAPDAGYRHIGRCGRLESLVLMYCRETGDEATSHLAPLTTLKKYFASYNRITDRTPAILSGLDSLEELTFDTCTGVGNDGIAALARLPHLRSVSASGMPRVTKDVVAAFPSHVDVRYHA